LTDSVGFPLPPFGLLSERFSFPTFLRRALILGLADGNDTIAKLFFSAA
jgi:hypothetical protein